MYAQRNRGPYVRQPCIGRNWNLDVISHARRFDDQFVRMLLEDYASQMPNHAFASRLHQRQSGYISDLARRRSPSAAIVSPKIVSGTGFGSGTANAEIAGGSEANVPVPAAVNECRRLRTEVPVEVHPPFACCTVA